MTATTTKSVLYDENIKPPALCVWTRAWLCTANVARSPEDPQPHPSGFLSFPTHGFQVLSLECAVTFGLAGIVSQTSAVCCSLSRSGNPSPTQDLPAVFIQKEHYDNPAVPSSRLWLFSLLLSSSHPIDTAWPRESNAASTEGSATLDFPD